MVGSGELGGGGGFEDPASRGLAGSLDTQPASLDMCLNQMESDIKVVAAPLTATDLTERHSLYPDAAASVHRTGVPDYSQIEQVVRVAGQTRSHLTPPALDTGTLVQRQSRAHCLGLVVVTAIPNTRRDLLSPIKVKLRHDAPLLLARAELCSHVALHHIAYVWQQAFTTASNRSGGSPLLAKASAPASRAACRASGRPLRAITCRRGQKS